MAKREKILLAALGFAGLLYLLSRTTVGQGVTDKIARLIFGEEGERLDVYQDIGGKWTVGKGHLVLSTDTVNRTDGNTTAAVHLHPYGPVRNITQAESDAFFERDTATARNAVADRVNVPLTENQRAALASLVFNIGTGAFGTSTLLRKLNVGDYKAAADQFLVWKKVNGVDSPALLARRERERSLFLS